MSTAVRLAAFNLPQIKAITDHDDMDLYSLGEKKVALFAVIPDNDTTFVRPDRAFCIAEKISTAPHDNAGDHPSNRKAKADTGTQHDGKAASHPKAIGCDCAVRSSGYEV